MLIVPLTEKTLFTEEILTARALACLPNGLGYLLDSTTNQARTGTKSMTKTPMTRLVLMPRT
jgi:hypothetical protein